MTQNEDVSDENGEFEIQTGQHPTLIFEKSEIKLQVLLGQIPLNARAVWAVFRLDFAGRNVTVETLEVIQVAKPPTGQPYSTPTPITPSPSSYPSLTPSPPQPSPARPTATRAPGIPSLEPTPIPAPSCNGDLNCDGIITYADVDLFVLARDGPQAYAAMFPSCDKNTADINDDGVISDADVSLLTELLDTRCP